MPKIIVLVLSPEGTVLVLEKMFDHDQLFAQWSEGDKDNILLEKKRRKSEYEYAYEYEYEKQIAD